MKVDPLKLSRLRAMLASGEARRVRTAAGLSYREAGDGCGVSLTTIYRWENGMRAPRGEVALRYLAILEALAKVAA